MNSNKLLSLSERFLKLAEKEPWEDKPEGWDKKSVEKYYNTLTKCVEKIKDEEGIDDPESFCGSLKHHYD